MVLLHRATLGYIAVLRQPQKGGATARNNSISGNDHSQTFMSLLVEIKQAWLTPKILKTYASPEVSVRWTQSLSYAGLG